MDNEKMKMLAKSYTPEWKFSTDPGCDEGSAAAIIFQNILNDSEKRLASIMHKHKIQYMNLFDKFKDEPMETAKSYVKFNTVTGAPNAVYVKKGTKVFADSEKTTQRIVFETQDNIAATSAKLSDIYITDSRKEWIEHKSLESDLPFTAFLAKGENLSEHRFIMGFADAFDNLNNLDIELTFSSGENLDEVMEILCGENIRFEALCQEGFVPFDLVERVEESGAISPATIHLVMEDSNLKKDFLAGKECYQIAITAQRASSPLPPDVQISRVTLKLSRQNILPDEVYSSGIMQETGFFRPFGYPMEIYATCEFESKEVFSRKGALVELNFQLDFQEFSRPLPEYELLEEYRRVVMKRAPESPKPIVRAVHADYVILEYRSETGWKRLLTQESAETIASMFNGHKKGEKSLTFTVPEDLLKEKSTNNKPRMRFRLMRADGLYQVPSLVYCPAITEFKFKYRYDHSPILPDYAVTRNNFVEKELNFNVERNYTLFDNLIKEKGEEPTMYLGFDKNPGNVAPLSIFFQLENYADTPVEFEPEYLRMPGNGEIEFAALKKTDYTRGLRTSGALLVELPFDIAPCKLFGQELYWIRMVGRMEGEQNFNLPQIKKILLNMVRVENKRTQEEYFARDSTYEGMQMELKGHDLISAKVYVNEENNQEGENWVLWEAVRHRSHVGRVYELHMAAGRVNISKTALASVKIKESGFTVKVVYQTYAGSAANVNIDGITLLATSIRYISGVSNPIPAYGGYDVDEETTAMAISNIMRTRNKAVARQDYFYVIKQVSQSVKQIKCINLRDKLTIAVLIEEYEKGSHIFDGIRDSISLRLKSCSDLIPAGKELRLNQPQFIKMTVRMWLRYEEIEDVYETLENCKNSIRIFLDPLIGGFEGKGWEIGVLPTVPQLVAYFKAEHPDAAIEEILVTAEYEGNEFAVDNQITSHIKDPFAMAINGEHAVECRIGRQ